MKVDKAKLVEVFCEIGVTSAKKWSLEKLQEKVTKLESLKEADVEITDKGVASLYDDIVSAVAKGKEVTVVDSGSDGAAEAAVNGKAKGKKAKGAKPAAEKKGPGVIASIVEFLQGGSSKKPLTKDTLLDKLEKRFPERGRDAMAQTVNIQIPNRLRVDKGIHVQKNENGYWVEGDGQAVGKSPAGMREKPKVKKKKAKAAA